MGGEFGEEWIHVYVWPSPFAAHLKLSRHCESVLPQCHLSYQGSPTYDRKRRERQRRRWLDGITSAMELTWANSGRWWGTGRPGMLRSMGSKESGTTWLLNNNKTPIQDKKFFKKESDQVSASTNVQLYSCDSSHGELSHLGCQNLNFAWWSLTSIFFPLSSTWYTHGLLLVKYEL